MVSHPLKATTDAILQQPTLTAGVMDCRFYSTTDQAYSFKPVPAPSSLDIIQDPRDAVMDNVRLTFQISSRDYADMYAHAQDLMMAYTWTYIDPIAGRKAYDPPPVTRQYRVMLTDAADVQRQTANVQYRTDPDRTVTVQLITEEAYTLRHRRFHAIFGEATTVEAMIRYVTSAFNVKTLRMVPPDNTHTYNNPEIPPDRDITTLFIELQKTKGVYTRGFHVYYTQDDGVLSIYPPYTSKQFDPDTAVIYAVQQGEVAGAISMHRKMGSVVEIISCGHNRSIDHSLNAAEDHGTAALMLRSSRVVDGYSTKDDVYGARFQKDAAVAIRNPDARPLSSSAANPRYVTTTDNAFQVMSAMQAYQSTLMEVTWTQAVPYLLRPGMAITLLYDRNGSIANAKGRLLAIAYQTRLVKTNTEVGAVYECAAKLTVWLEIEKPQETA